MYLKDNDDTDIRAFKLLEENGDFEGALNHINKNERLILDKVALR